MFLNRAYEFLFTTVCIAFDFWVVKNLTGRNLVGLKWWSTVDKKGNQKWKFLGSKNSKCDLHSVKFSTADKTFFYLGLFCYPLCWIALMVLQLLTIDALEVGYISESSFCSLLSECLFHASTCSGTTSVTTSTDGKCVSEMSTNN